MEKKKLTGRCEERDSVFEDPILVKEHQSKKKHRITETEFLITEYYYF
jgi:hypothetical protein